MQSPFASSLDLQDLADQAERFMLMSYERLPHANVLHNDSWALALGGHAREIALRQPGASPDLPPLARAAALLEACRYWGRPGEIFSWPEIIQEFRQWTGPDYLNLHLALKAALPGGNSHQRAEVADVLHDALLAQRLLAGAEGAELAWLENRYANNTQEAASPEARLASLNGYLNEIRHARFRNGELRRQYQHTHSAVLLDLQRLVDKLSNRIAPSPFPAPAAAPEKLPGDSGDGITTPSFQQLGDLENGPTRQATQTYFRTVFRNHINLVAMADQKAAIMISVNTLLIGALVTFTSYRNWAETRPEVLLPVGLFTICGLVSLVYAALAARPSGKAQTEENLAFFGFFSTLSRADFAARMEQQLLDPNALYGMLVNDLHGLGQSLARKYALLRIAFTIFLAGLVISVLVLALVISL
ncbi:MAG: Pycsar system effector family protein [Lewinella sp.]